MTSFMTRILFVLCSVAACTDDVTVAPRALASPESVQLVLYFSDGDADFKTVGETLLLNTGETVKVQRGVVRPDVALITHDWNGQFLPAARAAPVPGTLDMKLDRTNGLICREDKCARLYDICPHMSSLDMGSKCQVFDKQKGK
jgi:hypothetical protein